MTQKLADLSPEEFTALVEAAVDRRLNVWFTQVLDALTDDTDESGMQLQPEFAAALRRSLEQAQNENTIDLQTLRAQLDR